MVPSSLLHKYSIVHSTIPIYFMCALISPVTTSNSVCIIRVHCVTPLFAVACCMATCTLGSVSNIKLETVSPFCPCWSHP